MDSHRSTFAARLILLPLLYCFAVSATAQPKVPEWAKDAIWYQIFPERFGNGDPTNDPPNVQPWGGKPEGRNFFGGDLQGILNHLPYIKALGPNAIYLNPIFEATTNHKYQTSDYNKIDHHFGTEETFRSLVGAIHTDSMKLILDGVFNHTGSDFFAFKDIREKGEASPYLHWYSVHSFPVKDPREKNPNYETWWGIGDMPKLMTDSPAVRSYLFDASAHWMKLGIDGWRLDVPNELSHDFWIQWRKLVKGINPDAYIVGEIWDDATPWLQGDQFDGVMNYRFRGACVGFIALENRTASQFDSILLAQRNAYPAEINYVLQNLIGSHDTERFLTLCNGNVNKLKLAVLMQMTYVGAPMIYYGDEIGMTGGKDPDCRKTMVWDSTQWNTDLLQWYRKMIRIRSANPVLRRGDFATALVDDRAAVYAFTRSMGSTKALIILNNGDAQFSLAGKFNQLASSRWIDLLTNGAADLSAVILQPRSGAIFLTTESQR